MRKLILSILACTGVVLAGPVEVSDAELDSVYARGLHLIDREAISTMINELRDTILEIVLPEELGDGIVIVAPSEVQNTAPDTNYISLGNGSQENAINTINSVESAVNQVLNIIVIINSNINEANLNIMNDLEAINLLF